MWSILKTKEEAEVEAAVKGKEDQEEGLHHNNQLFQRQFLASL